MVINKYLSLVYLTLISIVGFIYYDGVIDIVGFQWMYLNIINTFGLLLILYQKINSKEKFYFKNNPQLIFYIGYFITSCFSLTYTLNNSVTIIALSKLSTVLICYFILNNLNFDNVNLLKYISYILTLYLSIEVIMSMKGYFDIINVTSFDLSLAQDYMRGTTANKNITSASIAFKIPFAFILIRYYKSFLIKIFLFVLLSFSFLNLFLLSSRAIFFSISLSIIFIIVAQLIAISFNLKKIKILFKQTFIYILPIIISFSVFHLINKNDKANVISRVESISSSDVSSTTRVRYYTKGINYFLANPIIGCGLGNWQLISLKLDSDNVESYIVPYVAHNDFIELLTEIGFIGGIFYMGFVLIVTFFLIKIFFEVNNNFKTIIIYLSIPFIIYFIDSNLNFPQYRPIMQIGFLVYSFLIYKIYEEKKFLL